MKPLSLLKLRVFSQVSVASFTRRSMYPAALSNMEVLLKSVRFWKQTFFGLDELGDHHYVLSFCIGIILETPSLVSSNGDV
jgi:hypothetical protein